MIEVPALPPRPPRLRGRAVELASLSQALGGGGVSRVALVGGGGSGKSWLAAALAHRLAPRFAGGAHWFRVGDWDYRTLLQMLAWRWGVRADPLLPALRQAMLERGPCLLVLDNHENDRAVARLLDLLGDLPTTWVLTARRCLLSGVSLFPIVPPLAQARRSAFPQVAALTELLRWNPLALDIASALVETRAASVATLAAWLRTEGAGRVQVMAHEDDVVEVRLLVDWAWNRLDRAERELLLVLAHAAGDDLDGASLLRLAKRRGSPEQVLKRLRKWRLIQEPRAGRFALHAVVRYAIQPRGTVESERYFTHYVALLERQPARATLEQTHLFAA
ncbi:MAG TPA: hypothetical protein VIU64_22560, partial [Polyangia bacterium]